jgi:hypothetical protein
VLQVKFNKVNTPQLNKNIFISIEVNNNWRKHLTKTVNQRVDANINIHSGS